MTDIVDATTRSRMMAGIRGRDTQPELLLRRALHAAGFRYRVHGKGLPGKPDMVFARYRAVVFVHGCFWHRHEACRYATIPATRRDFWRAKFHSNVERDRNNQKALLELGWRVAIVWECALKKQPPTLVAQELADWLINGGSNLLTLTGNAQLDPHVS